MSKITDAGILDLARGCPELTSVNLTGIFVITDIGVSALAQGCPLLSTIEMGHCHRITKACVSALAHACPNLTRIDALNCRGIDSDFICHFRIRYPLIVIRHTHDDNLGWC